MSFGLFTFCALGVTAHARAVCSFCAGPYVQSEPVPTAILKVSAADGQVGHHGVLVGGDPLHLVLLGIGVEPGVDIVHEKF